MISQTAACQVTWNLKGPILYVSPLCLFRAVARDPHYSNICAPKNFTDWDTCVAALMVAELFHQLTENYTENLYTCGVCI